MRFFMCFFTICFFIASIHTSWASDSKTQTARIIVPRAIVYSDENLNSPLGYISNNKLIKVGNPRIKNPDLVPLIVYGRLAYIELKNIHFENDSLDNLNYVRGAPREHNIDLVLEPEDKNSLGNSFAFSLRFYPPGVETNALLNALNLNKINYFTSFNFSIIHQHEESKMLWGIGLEYGFFSSSDFTFRNTFLTPLIGRSLLSSQNLKIDLILTLYLGISSQISFDSPIYYKYSPYIFGPELKTSFMLIPDKKTRPIFSVGIQNLYVSAFKTSIDRNGGIVPGITQMSGITFSGSINREF